MSIVLKRVLCIRFNSLKEKIRLVKSFEIKGYTVEILDDKFVYAEKRTFL